MVAQEINADHSRRGSGGDSDNRVVSSLFVKLHAPLARADANGGVTLPDVDA